MNNNMLLDSVLLQIDNILENLRPSKLDAYRLTQERLHEVDVSIDRMYQKNYTGFYVLRLPTTEAYKGHFSLLERNKINESIEFNEIIASLGSITGRIEASFSSKIVATINPNVAPLDSIVLGHLGLKLPRYYESDRLRKCIKTYECLTNEMNLLVTNRRFNKIKLAFCKKFPGYVFSDVKILDLILWKYRT